MIIIKSSISDPIQNLAIEEYLMREYFSGDDIVFLYINDPCIVVGRNQSVWQEVNTDFIEKTGIPVLRRISGGGTVFHDEGNVNISFITKNQFGKFNKYSEFTYPVISLLNECGAEAYLNSRNDICIGEKKISGNAQFTSAGKLLSHGTLLIDSNLAAISESLKVKPGISSPRASKSFRSKVMNVSEIISGLKAKTFIDLLISRKLLPGAKKIMEIFPDEIIEKAKAYEKKYSEWEWTYALSPETKIERVSKDGSISLSFTVIKGIVSEFIIEEDRIPKSCSILEGTVYSKHELESRLISSGCTDYKIINDLLY